MALIDWGPEKAKLHLIDFWEGVSSPYRRLARIKPGQSWFELPQEPVVSASQHYVKRIDSDPIPPEAAAAQLLMGQGALEAFVIENWSGIGIMSHALMGVSDQCKIWGLINKYKTESNRSKGGGFPDVVAYWPDGKVSICEVKIKGKDHLTHKQKTGVKFLKRILAEKLDLRVFEWEGN